MSAAGPPQGAKAPAGGSAAREAASVGACYIGRFAPSPTGPLHAGSLVAALASWLDARAHGGQWLVRIEDVDTPRCVKGAHFEILRQLAACGLLPDAPPIYQSQRSPLYQAALQQLVQAHAVYPCVCSRSDIQTACQALGQQVTPRGEWVYPGTCRAGLNPTTAHTLDNSARQPAYRFKVFNDKNTHFPNADINKYATNSIVNTVHWQDRRLGCQQQNVANDVGDFVLRRTDGLWAYQLAVVVDDAQQGVTHVVRGEDLADNTARQILLQRALGYSTPHYLHTPLVLAQDGYKLSKQNGAAPLGTQQPEHCLRQAATVLGLNEKNVSDCGLLTSLIAQWLVRYPKA